MTGSSKAIAGSWRFEAERLAITAREKGEGEDARFADYADGAIPIEECLGGKLMKMWGSRLPTWACELAGIVLMWWQSPLSRYRMGA